MFWAEVLCGAVGITMLIAGVATAFATKRFIDRAARVPGTVLENVTAVDDEGGTTYRPKFSFRTLDGRAVTVTGRTGTNPPSFRAGETVQVLYDARDPEGASIESFMQLWFVSILLGGLGLIFSGIAAGLLWFGGRG